MSEILKDQSNLYEPVVRHMIAYIRGCQPELIENQEKLPSQKLDPQDPDNQAPYGWTVSQNIAERYFERKGESPPADYMAQVITQASQTVWEEAEDKGLQLPLTPPKHFLGLDEDLKAEIAPYFTRLYNESH